MGRRARRDLPVEWIEPDQPAGTPGAPPNGRDHVPSGPLGVPSRRGAARGRLLLFAVAAAGIVAIAIAVGHDHRRAPLSGPAPATVPATVAPLRQPVLTSEAGHPLLLGPATWEIVGRSQDELVRIQLASGHVTRTAVPPLASSGPVYLVAGADRVVIRPLDFVPGYVVPDSQAATTLTGLLNNGGPAFPGPDGAHLWIAGAQRQMELVGFDGTPTGLVVPSPDTSPIAGDGTGYLLFTKSDGVYLARPALTKLAVGTLIAVGPTRLLTEQCTAQPACHLVVTDRATGASRPLGPFPLTDIQSPLGQISPDGATAAITEYSPDGSALHLIDLASGRDRATGGQLETRNDGTEQAVAWTPDSRTLFYVDPFGVLYAVAARTGTIAGLGVTLPPLFQIVFRVTPG